MRAVYLDLISTLIVFSLSLSLFLSFIRTYESDVGLAPQRRVQFLLESIFEE